MNSAAISLASLTTEQQARFKSLTRTPVLAWPTFCMWIVLMLTFFASDYLAVTRHIPLWLGMLINSVVGYLAFSVVHDSIHRAVSSNTRLNDWIGQLAVLLVVPYVSLKLFRWGHILHHRFASGPRDPDIVLHGAWWSLPFRWMFIDGFYLLHTIRYGDKVSRPYFIESLWAAAVSFTLIISLIALGYGLEVLMLWFIPSRLIQLALGFTFFWLPHVPHDTSQEENFTRATTIREGHEWLLGPALQYQNFHLIHHLFPMTPFYNNSRVWQVLESELRQKDLAIQHGFAIQPTIYAAPSRDATLTHSHA
jgi:beta-carotene hydroxylase